MSISKYILSVLLFSLPLFSQSITENPSKFNNYTGYKPGGFQTACPTYDVTLQLGYGTNDYPATLAGINSAILQAHNDSTKCYHIQVLSQGHGGPVIQTSTTSVNFPAYTPPLLPPSKYIVLGSDVIPPEGKVACVDGFTDVTGPDPRTDNWDCVSDKANMFVVEKTSLGSTPAINFEPGTSHIVIENMEARVQSSQPGLVNQIIKIGANDSTQGTVALAPDHIGFNHNFVHGYDPGDPGAGINGTAIQRLINNNGAYVWFTNNLLDKAHTNGADSQAILSLNSPGPIGILHNALRGGAETVLFGGGAIQVNDLQPSDVEVRFNLFSKNIIWKQWTGSTVCNAPCSQHYAIKNAFEIKSGLRFIIEGNIFENTWLDGQDALFVLNGTGYGSAIATGSTVTKDIRVRNNIFRHAPELATMQARSVSSGGDPGTFTAGTRNIDFSNNEAYDIAKNSVYGIGSYRVTGGSSNGNASNATVTRLNGIATFTSTSWTSTCPGCTFLNTGIAPGDFVRTMDCADASFNTFSTLTHGPLARPETDSTHTVIDNPGPDVSTPVTGCTVWNGEGWPRNVRMDHLTMAFSDNIRIYLSAFQSYARDLAITNGIYAAAYVGSTLGITCAGKSVGTNSEKCFDTASFDFRGNVLEGMTASAYTEYPGGVSPPPTSKFPVRNSCLGAVPDATCIGWKGFMNGAAYPPADWYAFDYHGLDLLPTSVFAAGQLYPGVDGQSRGVDFVKLDAAMNLVTSNKYTCDGPCGTTYPLVNNQASPPVLSANLSWTASTTPSATYTIKKSLTPTGVKTILATGITALSYVDSSNDYGCYVVTAIAPNMLESDESNQVCTQPPVAKASAPGTLSVSNTN